MLPFPPALLLFFGGATALLAFGGFTLYMRLFFGMRKHGKRIVATVTKINMEYALLARGRNTTSFFLHAEWEDPATHKVYHFKSGAGDVNLPINHPPGSTIDVLIDPRNPRRYKMLL
ncbi:MAG TPA: DUF3592 domain-containing protein [Ktedonobacteraceae bacterium]|nr:DUF3592 domain-containing protein [Ktedonobacteraceae bacterium]